MPENEKDVLKYIIEEVSKLSVELQYYVLGYTQALGGTPEKK